MIPCFIHYWSLFSDLFRPVVEVDGKNGHPRVEPRSVLEPRLI